MFLTTRGNKALSDTDADDAQRLFISLYFFTFHFFSFLPVSFFPLSLSLSLSLSTKSKYERFSASRVTFHVQAPRTYEAAATAAGYVIFPAFDVAFFGKVRDPEAPVSHGIPANHRRGGEIKNTRTR
jgi:hypothetical protein